MPVAKAINVEGEVTATNAQCEVRTINEGDMVEAGEIIKTGEGANIDLELIGGGVISLEAKQTLTLDNEFLATIIPDAKDSALFAGGGDINSIISAIRKGSSLDSLLEDTAAGLGSSSATAGGASSEGGTGFVMLTSVVEAISPPVAADPSLNRGPVIGSDTFAAAQAVAAIQAAAHFAATQAAAHAAVIQAAAANTVMSDTIAPIITLDPSAGVNAPITGTVTGTGSAVSAVQVTATNAVTGAATTVIVAVAVDGTFTAPAPAVTGTYTVAVTATDTAGNTSTVGGTEANTIVVDTTAPVITLDPPAGVNAPITGTVTDTGGTVGTVQVTATNIATGVATTTTVPVQANGAFTVSAPTDTGTYTVTVTAIDNAGNVSVVGGSTANTVVVDTTAPASATISLVNDSGNSHTDHLTNNAALTVSAAAEGVTRTYSVNGGEATSSYTAPTADGNYTVRVTDIDAAGNATTSSLSFALDKTAPAGAAISLVNDSGSSPTDLLTSNAALTVSAAAEGVTRTYSVNGGEATSSYIAPTVDGNYTVSVTDTDAAGNATTSSLSFALDKTAPAGAAISLINDSGSSPTDLLTSNAALTVSAAAEGVTRTYSVNGGEATSSYTAPTADGNYTVRVTDTDAAGNVTTSSLSFTLDTTATASITVDNITADNIINAAEAGGIIAVTGAVGGDAKAGDPVTLTVNGNEFSGTVNADKTFSINIAGANLQADATIDAKVTGQDSAGNPYEGTTTHTHGVDTVVGETLRGGHGDDTLVGGAGNDTLYGYEGKDNLYGGAGNDTLYGGEGKDTLHGGLGNDLLYGGEGKDVFAWSPADIGRPGNPAVDTIADFKSKNDSIDLRNLLDGVEVGKNDIGNLLSYINVSKEGADTVLRISSQGGFDNGEYHPSKEDQTIVIKNADLTVQNGEHEHDEHEHGVDQTATLLNMLKNGNLNVNGN
ncbi:MAG: retention module-containing protein [Gallionella sp.]|nr:retention module-containing protein [Gallionella sp.]